MPVLARLHLSAETEIGRHASQRSVITSREEDMPRVAADSQLIDCTEIPARIISCCRHDAEELNIRNC